MRTILGIVNIFLIVAMIGCAAGALAGLIVFLPFVAGAWALNLVALVGCEEAARARQREVTYRKAVDAANAEASPEGGRARQPVAAPGLLHR